MTTAVTRREDGTVALPLKTLIPMIRVELEAGHAAGVEHYRKAGEHLLDAKPQVMQSGKSWTSWLAKNFKNADGKPLSHDTALRYMRFAEQSNTRRRVFRTIEEAIGDDRSARREREQRSHRAEASASARQQQLNGFTKQVDFDALRRERQDRDREEKLVHKIALQLVDVGYRVMAAKEHPDKGGTSEGMARLTRVRNWLNDLIKRGV
jgi:hypothetical protein